MLSRIVHAALAASCLLRMAFADQTLIPTASTTPAMNALTAVGCFSTPEPMVDYGPYTFQTSGNCQPICYELQQPVMGLVNGSNCWCGALIPPVKTQVDNSSCSTPCNGYDKEMCGGNNFWTVYLTGITRNKIGNLDPASLSGTSGAGTSKTAASAAGPSTVVVTAKPSSSGKSGGSSTVGVAVGVVVGVVAIVGIVLGVLLFLRHKKRKEAEEEYKRQLAVSGFVNGGKHHHSNSSMNDSRLDPEAMAARRESTGSIADNADYSRRILQVRNPDGF